jgi:hypothetical protein
MKIDADSNGSVGKFISTFSFVIRVARIYELYALGKSDSIIYEARAL